MKTYLKFVWAMIRCNFYLLFRGMWRGEQRMIIGDQTGVQTIAAVKTVLSPGAPGGVKFQVAKIFYER